MITRVQTWPGSVETAARHRAEGMGSGTGGVGDGIEEVHVGPLAHWSMELRILLGYALQVRNA